jgi:MFS-type transporter involved in bile tolerance (Atg22 family)
MKLIKNRSQFAWVLYDWANSAFATTVMAGFFPVFFKNYWSASADVNMSTAYLGMANSIASLIVALLAPVLGAIADQGKSRKKFLIFFAYMSVLMTSCLFFVEMGNWKMALFLYIMGTIGFSGGNIFYDALLPTVVDEKKIDYISAKGYAFGYLGGGILFLINVLWYTMPATFGFDVEYRSVVREITNNNSIEIQVDEDNFDLPVSQNIAAVLTSHLHNEIKTVNYYNEGKTSYAVITLQQKTDFDAKNIDETIVFGKYKQGEFVEFNAGLQTLTVKNLTRRIASGDPVKIKFDTKIKIGTYADGWCKNVEGLDAYYKNPTIKTDLLQPAREFLPVRLSFLSVALWWGIFTIPLIRWIKEKKNKIDHGIVFYVKKGFRQLYKTFQEIKHMKYIFTFLIAYWMYIDGVNTVIRMAVDYGMSIGLPSDALIIALLITQFVGFPAALLFGKLGEKWSVKNSLFIGIFVYLGINVWAVFMNDAIEFYFMAIIIGIVQGGIQALSRSMYSRLIPINQSAEYYGFFNMTGKFAAIFGPAMVGVINLAARAAGVNSNLATRIGIGSIIILFIGGGTFLYFVDIEKGRQEVAFLKNIKVK